MATENGTRGAWLNEVMDVRDDLVAVHAHLGVMGMAVQSFDTQLADRTVENMSDSMSHLASMVEDQIGKLNSIPGVEPYDPKGGRGHE